ncbi:glycosyltransferase family 4 protein [Ihubacter massiliensis]|uniref:Glycosyltransferase family 4 protein n=1 Tax=Hominibacterium faecale TaxID=2839743 RepID=A0A9J6QY16_9FIRM|nr:glycosyltransferase family 4 protein [Hominibacterium faecale]MCO7123743.1 glycosyltransferase family 4 protein [Ihubacter massiliensis]MCU7380398.1 glycosyltransferase family 4 protein [Hominibacterium faecale]
MNILIINHYAGSPDMGMEFRPYYFAREWIKMGHKVDIIAADFSHLRRANPQVDHDFQEEVIDEIHYHWIKTGTYEGNGGKRAMTMFQFVSKLWIHAKSIIAEMEPDVVIASSTYPLDTYVGQRIRKLSKKKVKLIHEVHDMWPISPVELGGMSPKHPFIRVLQKAENSFCKNSDVVVSLLPAAKNYFIEHGMDADKFRHVPNGVVLEEWENPQPLPENLLKTLLKVKKEGKFILCFFGSHTQSYALDYLIDAVKELEQVNLQLIFIGNGIFKEELKKQAYGYEDSILFLEPIPKACIPSVFEHIDASYVGALDNNMFRFGICMNKLFDSMMGGKPILYAVKAPNNYIDEYKCGISVETENVSALKEGILQLISLSAEDREKLGTCGRNAVLEYFNYKFLAKQFELILKENMK